MRWNFIFRQTTACAELHRHRDPDRHGNRDESLARDDYRHGEVGNFIWRLTDALHLAAVDDRLRLANVGLSQPAKQFFKREKEKEERGVILSAAKGKKEVSS